MASQAETRGSRRRTAPAARHVPALLCLAGEVLLVAALAAGVPAAPVAVAHLALVAGTTMLIVRREGDWAVALMIGASTLTLGPVGTAAALVGARRAEAGTRDPTLADWHERIIDRPPVDPVEALYRDIVEGRAYRPLGIPEAFADIMETGDVGKRQRLLGLLGKRAGPAPAGLIEAGLSAPELAVRAPAAAVVARLREREREAGR